MPKGRQEYDCTWCTFGGSTLELRFSLGPKNALNFFYTNPNRVRKRLKLQKRIGCHVYATVLRRLGQLGSADFSFATGSACLAYVCGAAAAQSTRLDIPVQWTVFLLIKASSVLFFETSRRYVLV